MVGAVKLDKPFIIIGRLAQCDVMLEHPSISRLADLMLLCCIIMKNFSNVKLVSLIVEIISITCVAELSTLLVIY